MNFNGEEDGTLLSPRTSSPTAAPAWGRPKSPLPPHRLAKLANALGVSTPTPAGSISLLSRSYSESMSPIEMRRSPTPSTVASSMGFSSCTPPSTSRFLLHVIPPMHLPHDSGNSDDSLIPPPPNAPGYHTQFRRGTLVPVHSTLQAQLGAIAKEYALPSAAGLILYLVISSQSSSPKDIDEPGPRLSEDIWKHLWTRVVRAEQNDDLLMPSLSPQSATPQSRHNILGFGPAARSTPFLPQEHPGPLRRFLSSPGEPPLTHAPQPLYPLTATPSTPSISDIRSNNNKSAPPSSSSVSQSEPDTPDTSIEESGLQNPDLDLPGLNSPSLIPILAKVEFDIDRQKAAWYGPWMRSRKVNHAKRAGSRQGSRGETDSDEPRGRLPIQFLTGKKKSGLFGLSSDEPETEQEDYGYARLSESPEEVVSNSESDTEDFGEGAAARGPKLSRGKDPLDDVFGTDADTWADIHAENGRKRKNKNPNIVNLALTADELSNQIHLEDDGESSTVEEDELLEMLDLMGNPRIALNVASPLKKKRPSSPTSLSSRKVPPPLVLKKHKDKSGMAINSSSNVRDFEDLGEDDATQLMYSEKRGGAVFDDLDPTEDFDDDPNDRRRSQIIMKEQLDAIERAMAQLSPRILSADLADEQNNSFHSAGSPGKSSLSPGGIRSSDLFPHSSPRLPRHPDPPETSTYLAGQSWPAVPFSMIKDKEDGGSASNPDAPPSPPRLAVNGVTTSAPRSYQPTKTPPTGPTESERRKKLEEEEGSLYPLKIQTSAVVEPSTIPLSPDPFSRHPSTTAEPPPNLPMSPSPWDTVTPGINAPTTQTEAAPEPSERGRTRSGTTSRFSADSVNGSEEPGATKLQSNRMTLMSVKGITKLWRKGNNKSISSSQPTQPPTPSPLSSGRTSPMAPPQRPERPSQEQLDLPDVPPVNFAAHQMSSPVPHTSQDRHRPSEDQQVMPPPANIGRLSPQPSATQTHPNHRPSLDQQNIPQTPSRPSADQLGSSSHQLSVPSYPGQNLNPGPIITPHMQASKAASNLDRLRFDQESPYPIRPARQSPRPTSPVPLPGIPEQEKQPVARKSILKWKSAASVEPNAAEPSSDSRTSYERPVTGGSRGRRPSVINFGSTRASLTSADLPPSPPIPLNYLNANAKNGQGLESRQSQRSKLTTPSAESYSPPQRNPSLQSQSSLNTRSSSPPRSRASSRDSRDSGPSFDASQFEFVSPKGGTVSYPYNELDH